MKEIIGVGKCVSLVPRGCSIPWLQTIVSKLTAELGWALRVTVIWDPVPIHVLVSWVH